MILCKKHEICQFHLLQILSLTKITGNIFIMSKISIFDEKIEKTVPLTPAWYIIVAQNNRPVTDQPPPQCHPSPDCHPLLSKQCSMDPPNIHDQVSSLLLLLLPLPASSWGTFKETLPQSRAIYCWFLHHWQRPTTPLQQKIGVELSRNAQFCSYFGCSAEVALIFWKMFISFALVPYECQILHFLWALFFMKV